MAEARPEPSMEDILASIKRIIADDAPGAPPRPSLAPPAAIPAPRPSLLNDPALDDSILELTNPAPAPVTGFPASPAQPQERAADRFRQAVSARVGAAGTVPSRPAPVDTVSAPSVAPAPVATRAIPSLAAPTIAAAPAPAAPVAPAREPAPHVGTGETIEGLVRGLVSDWLAANLPAITEKLVREEIARIRDAED